MTVALATEELQARLAALKAQPEPPKEYRYVKPFSSTVDGILSSLKSSDGRFALGIGPVDTLTRGFGPKELVFITGFAHSGKTQLVNTAILNNLNKRILFFSMDDPAEMILLKLTCMYAQMPADELEHLIHADNKEAQDTLKRAANDIFKNLIVVDDSLGLSNMDKAIAEAQDMWGADPDLVVIDYLELMSGNGNSDDANSNVKSKSQALKGWVKGKNWPTVVLHQGTRSGSEPGKPITMTSMAYGGEQEATIVIGVRRKKDDRDGDIWMRQTHENTVTLHVVKNKRPPAKITKPDGLDLFMDKQTGIIRTLRPGELQGSPLTVEREKASATTSIAALERTVELAERAVAAHE